MKKVALTLLAIIFLAGCAELDKAKYGKGNPTEQDAQSCHFGEYPNNYQQIIKDYCEGILKDPGAAIYKFDPKLEKGVFKTKNIRVCGYLVKVQINGKNSYGGYTGFQDWVFVIENGRVGQYAHLEVEGDFSGYDYWRYHWLAAE